MEFQVSELDEVMNGIQAQNQPDNELDTIMQDVVAEQRQRQRIMDLAREATRTTPADAAQRINVGRKTGVAPSLLVDADTRASYEQMAKLMNVPVEKLTRSRIGEWLAQNPDNMALAQNSFDPMLAIEGKHQAIVDHRRQVAEQNQRDDIGWWHGMVNSFAQGANQLATIPGDLAEMAVGLVGSPETLKTFQDARKRPVSAVAVGALGPIAGSMLMLDKVGRENLAYLKSGPQRHRQDLLVRDAAGNEVFNWGAINLENVSAILAQEAPAFAAAAALAPGSGGVSIAPYVARFGRAGKAITALVKYSTKAPALLETARTATSIYDDGKQSLMSQGMSEGEAGTKAAPGALLAGIFSSLAGSPMEARFFDDLVNKTARIPGGFGIANQLRARSKALVSMGAKEGTQEVVQGMGEDLAQWLTFQPDMTIKQAGANAIMNFVGGAAMGGPAGGIAVGSRSIQQQQNMDFMNALHEGAQNSEVYKLMPAKWQEMVDHLTKDGPLETIGMPVSEWNTFWQTQGVDPSEKAAEMGVSPEEYRQAVQLDSDLTIRTSEFAAKVAGTDAYPELVQSVRFEYGTPTMREEEAQKKPLP
jgi:hypothetical protein